MTMIEQGEFPDRDGGGGGHTHPGPAGALRACGAGLDAAKRKFPKENLELRKKAQIMHRHDGAPNPEPEAAVPDPDLLDWDVNLIRGKKADFKGTVAAKDHKSAIDVAIERFKLAQWQIERLVVTVRIRPVYWR
jgi:hypothetical protein